MSRLKGLSITVWHVFIITIHLLLLCVFSSSFISRCVHLLAKKDSPVSVHHCILGREWRKTLTCLFFFVFGIMYPSVMNKLAHTWGLWTLSWVHWLEETLHFLYGWFVVVVCVKEKWWKAIWWSEGHTWVENSGKKICFLWFWCKEPGIFKTPLQSNVIMWLCSR